MNRHRIGIEDSSGFRPLLAFGMSADGGLMLDLSNRSPLKTFSYGVMTFPAGSGEVTATPREDERTDVSGTPPKMHYHRTGYLSFNATDRLPRQGFQCTPIDQLGDHVQVFQFTAVQPADWLRGSRRKCDIPLAVSGPPLQSIRVVGRIGSISALNEPHRSKLMETGVHRDAFVYSEGDILPTLLVHMTDRARSLDRYLWLEIHHDVPFETPPGPAVVLHAMDGGRISNGATTSLACWAVTSIGDR